MRIFSRLLVMVGVVSLVGCDRTTPIQPDVIAGAPPGSQQADPTASRALAAKPEIDPTYANGTTVYMIGPHLIEGARESMPQAYEHAEELYLLVYPQASLPLPSGYKPQCNPCFHPGLPPPFVYHDHVITGAPGMGANGTAGEYKAPWKIVIIQYNPDYLKSAGFTPITSAADIDAAEAAGKAFLPFNHTPGANPYEFEPGNLLICPTVSSKA